MVNEKPAIQNHSCSWTVLSQAAVYFPIQFSKIAFLQ